MYLENYVKIFILMLGFCSTGFSQVMELSITENRDHNPQLRCYEMSIVAPQGDIALAGQNYRLYYNGHHAHFQESSLTTQLAEPYTLQLKEHIYDVDASQYGNLLFDSHLSFINFYIDFDSQDYDDAQLISDAATTVAAFCFESESSVELNFARKGITDGYATAFNQIAMIDEAGHQPTVDIAYRNESTDTDSSVAFNSLSKVFPNPFEDRFQLELSKDIVGTSGTLEVYNVYGSQVKALAFTSSDQSISIDLSGYLSGTYIIKVLDEDHSFIESIKATKLN